MTRDASPAADGGVTSEKDDWAMLGHLQSYCARLSSAGSSVFQDGAATPSPFMVMYSLVGSFLGILFLARIDKAFQLDQENKVMLVASFGAQAALVFGAPTAALAQPWNCIIGNLVSAIVGVSVYKVLP